MAINAKYVDKLDYRTYVLLGDGESAEGSNWEAAALAGINIRLAGPDTLSISCDETTTWSDLQGLVA